MGLYKRKTFDNLTVTRVPRDAPEVTVVDPYTIARSLHITYYINQLKALIKYHYHNLYPFSVSCHAFNYCVGKDT